jgi:serine protease Do
VAVTGGTLSNESSPVMTTDGRVIGLVRGQLPTSMQLYAANRWNDTMIRELQHTRGFVPTDEFAHVIANIPTPQQPRKLPWIGVVTYEPLTAVDTAATESLRGRPGVVVGRVIGESPATKADIRQRDVIVALDGKPLEALPTPELVVSNFSRLLSRFSPGAKVKVTILRDGKDQDREVLLTERPPTPSEAKRYYSARLGLAARDMVKWDEYMAPAMFIKRGVPITGVVPGGPVHQKLFVNDVITSVNKRRVTNVAELSAVLDPAAEGTAEITLTVLRRGMEQPVVVTPSGVPVPRGLPGD